MSSGFGAEDEAEPPVRLVPQVGWDDDERRSLASPDGRFAAAQIGQTLHIRDRRNERTAWILRQPQHSRMAFSPDGRRLAVFGRQQGLMLDLQRDWQTRFEDVGGVPAFSPDGRRLAVAQGLSYRVVDDYDLDDGFYPEGFVRQERLQPRVWMFDLSGEVLGSYLGTLAAPSNLAFSEDGRRLTLHGSHGRIQSRVGGYAATATVDLETGRVTVTRVGGDDGGEGRAERQPGAGPARGHAGVDPGRPGRPHVHPVSLGPEPDGLYWDGSRHSAVLALDRRGQGHRVLVWDLREGRLRHSVERGRGWAVGLIGAEGLLTTRPDDRELQAALLRLDTAEEHRLPIAGLRFVPSPDGRRIAVVRAEGDDAETRRLVVSVWEQAATPRKLWEDVAPARVGILEVRWATLNGDEVLLAHRHLQQSARRELAVHAAADGRLIRRFADNDRGVFSFAVSPDGRRLLLGLGSERTGSARIVDAATGEERQSVGDFPVWVNAAAFLDDGRAVLGTFGGHVVALWDLKADRLVWQTGTEGTVERLHHVAGSKHLVVQNSFRASAVLTVDDGFILRQTAPLVAGSSGDLKPWNMPQLIGDGTYCLEADRGVEWLRLVRTASGRTLLTFAPLPEGEWAVWTPEGIWTGSENAGDQLAVFRGDRLLPAEELEALRRPQEIEKVLRAISGQ